MTSRATVKSRLKAGVCFLVNWVILRSLLWQDEYEGRSYLSRCFSTNKNPISVLKILSGVPLMVNGWMVGIHKLCCWFYNMQFKSAKVWLKCHNYGAIFCEPLHKTKCFVLTSVPIHTSEWIYPHGDISRDSWLVSRAVCHVAPCALPLNAENNHKCLARKQVRLCSDHRCTLLTFKKKNLPNSTKLHLWSKCTHTQWNMQNVVIAQISPFQHF